MKKVILGIFSLLLISTSVFAQEDPVKAQKKATRALTAFNLDPTNGGEKLTEAKEMINIALKSEEVASTAKAWLAKGDIYSTSVGQDLAMKSVKDDHAIVDMDGALLANEAYMMAAKKAVKKYETKEAVEGISANINNLSNIGIVNFKAEKFAEAFSNFNAVMDAHNMLKEMGVDSPLDNEEQYNNAVYLAALGASSSNNMEVAAKYFDELAAKDYKDAAVYDGIYRANIDTNPEKAIAALEKGRKLFPENTALLFTEINYYLGQNKLDVLTGKLQTAIEKEPDNVTLYSTLGNVYDNLFQRENKEGNMDKSQEYFDLAMANYVKALEIDPDYSDATYSIGALYYNKAATYTQEQQDLGISKADLKKFDELSAKITDLFNLALPYFKKAEQANPTDLNTLIALKEIFAKTNEFDLSKEFKTRLETVQNGGTVESYFAGK